MNESNHRHPISTLRDAWSALNASVRFKLLVAALVPFAVSIAFFIVALLRTTRVVNVDSLLVANWRTAPLLIALAIQVVLVYQAHHAIRARYLAKCYPDEKDPDVLKRRWRLDDGGTVGVSLWADAFAPYAVISSLESLLFGDGDFIYLLLLIVFVVIVPIDSARSARKFILID